MKIEVFQTDITKVTADIIVNAANTSLLGGGGVDGAIHRKGGPEILEQCQQIRNRQGKCETGSAVITTAGNLSAKYVVHTVGPVWNGGNRGEREKLADCYRAALDLCCENHCRSIAFPNISTGIYGFPKEEAAQIAISAASKFESTDQIDRLMFVCFDEENFEIYKGLLGH